MGYCYLFKSCPKKMWTPYCIRWLAATHRLLSASILAHSPSAITQPVGTLLSHPAYTSIHPAHLVAGTEARCMERTKGCCRSSQKRCESMHDTHPSTCLMRNACKMPPEMCTCSIGDSKMEAIQEIQTNEPLERHAACAVCLVGALSQRALTDRIDGDSFNC